MFRPRISLRLALLLMGLVAVFFAWVGARRELNRTLLRGQIREWEIDRDYAATRVNHPQEGAHWRKALIESEEKIKSKRRALGEPLGPAN